MEIAIEEHSSYTRRLGLRVLAGIEQKFLLYG